MSNLGAKLAYSPKCLWAIFDLDDTLIRRAPHIVQQANTAALRLLSADPQDLPRLAAHLAAVYRQTTQGSAVLVAKRQQFTWLLQRLGQAAQEEQLFAAYIARYLDLVQVFPDAQPTLATLASHGVRIGIATNGPPDVVEAVLHHADLRRFVECIVTPALAGVPKSSPAFATFLAAQTGSDARQIVVGDQAEDMRLAKRMGATAVLLAQHRPTQLEVKPDYIIQTLSELLPICLAPRDAS